MNRQIGIILLAAGIGLLVWGYNLSDSFSSRFSRAFTGSPTNKASTILIAGGVCTALGIYNLMKKSGR
jgi:hypothetical protein